MSKFLKKLILILTVVIICIIILLIIIFSNNSENLLENPDPPEIMQTEDENILMECKATNEYFIVKKVLTDYYLYCSNLKYKASDIDTFGSNISKEELEKSAQIEREKSQEIVYNMLDKEYISEFNIQKNDIISKFSIDRNIKSIIKKINYFKNSTNVNTYIVYGMNLSENKNNEFKIAISLDMLNKTFSIYPEEYLKKYKVDELNVGEHIEEKNIDKIEKNSNNTFTYRNIKDNEIALEYFYNYKYLMMYNEESAYEILDKEYRNNRFKNIQNYKKYISENYDILKQCSAVKYQVNGNEGNKEYICLDNYGNYYIFNQRNISNYSLYLDTYTIETEDFLEKYNNSDESKKAGMNSEKFFEAINMKDYDFIYNHLSKEFKDRFYQSKEDLEKYLKENLFIYNGREYKDSSKEDDVYVLKVVVSDKYKESSEKNMTVVVKLKEGTDFVMSFSIN